MRASGLTGDISFADDLVVMIRRTLPGLAQEVQSYRIADIGSLSFKAASAIEPGFLRILPVGSRPGTFLSQDRNALAFNNVQHDQFAAMYSALHEARYGTKPDVSATAAPSIPSWVILVLLAAIAAYVIFLYFPVLGSILN
jgi:hypothetical protein